MLLRRAVDQCVEEKSSGSEIDDRRPSDASRINIAARKTRSDRRANIGALPDHRAGRGVERINIVRLGYANDHRPIRAALDVQGLSVDVAGNRAVKVQVAR